MGRARLRRTTAETDIRVGLDLDGRGRARISTGIGFFDHMLEQVARHGALDLEIAASGDLHVDQHHTVEDTGLALGEAVRRALGSKRGVLRAGYFIMPMDEALAVAAGRGPAAAKARGRGRLAGPVSRCRTNAGRVGRPRAGRPVVRRCPFVAGARCHGYQCRRETHSTP